MIQVSPPSPKTNYGDKGYSLSHQSSSAKFLPGERPAGPPKELPPEMYEEVKLNGRSGGL